MFTYGSDGLRRRSVTNGTRTDFAIDGSTVVREMRDINSDGILESIATYFNGMYKRDDTNGTLRWYIYDGLGSVLAEVDPSGNVTAGRKYDVYGLVRSGQAGISKHKFVGKLGHPSEDETGLIYMRARYMDPVLGKFVSEDPARDGLNWYEYCRSNPTNMVDENGKVWTLLANGVGFLLGALAGLVWYLIYQYLTNDDFTLAGAGEAMLVGGLPGLFFPLVAPLELLATIPFAIIAAMYHNMANVSSAGMGDRIVEAFLIHDAQIIEASYGEES